MWDIEIMTSMSHILSGSSSLHNKHLYKLQFLSSGCEEYRQGKASLFV